MTDHRTCECGHKAHDHLGGVGRCNDGSRRCRCPGFGECSHSTVMVWRDRAICTVCRTIQPAERLTERSTMQPQAGITENAAGGESGRTAATPGSDQ